MDRRRFLQLGTTGAAAAAVGAWPQSNRSVGLIERDGALLHEVTLLPPPAYSLNPVVGDGKWIWTAPPKDETGYLEPRPYEARIGVELEGTGRATNLKATTPVPVAAPEQEVDTENVEIETQGCMASLRKLDECAAELALTAPSIVSGQTIRAVATFRLTLFKQYHGFKAEQFYRPTPAPQEIRHRYLQNSPGIETKAPEVSKLAAKLADKIESRWEQAERFKNWVWENIMGRPGRYTNVITALKSRVGDCEEKAAVFVALCRAVEIPARLVWVPNHNWAEFYLTDSQGRAHWIPAHTACYSWFGWTGAHELVLQKGDRIPLVERRGVVRMQADWAQWMGAKPKIRFLAEVRPLPASEGADPGPGARRKVGNGEWLVIGEHELDRKLRDGERIVAAKEASKRGPTGP